MRDKCCPFHPSPPIPKVNKKPSYGSVYSADAHAEADACNVARDSCNVADVLCNVARVSCNVTGNTCNITRNTCNITRVRVRVRRIHQAPSYRE